MANSRMMAVFCDETGTHDCDYFGWGSIWCPLEKVEELNAAIDRIASRYGHDEELGWKHASFKRKCYDEAVTWFFSCPWMCFQSLFVRKDRMRIFDQPKERSVAHQKLLCTMLATQIPWFSGLPGGPRRFAIMVDQVSESCRELTLKEMRIIGAASRKRMADPIDAVDSFARVDSRSQRGVQLADILVGAVRASWEDKKRSKTGKARLRRTIAECVGWSNLRAVTARNLKFNLWLHQDMDAKRHGFASRPVRWKYPKGDPQQAFDRLEFKR